MWLETTAQNMQVANRLLIFISFELVNLSIKKLSMDLSEFNILILSSNDLLVVSTDLLYYRLSGIRWIGVNSIFFVVLGSIPYCCVSGVMYEWTLVMSNKLTHQVSGYQVDTLNLSQGHQGRSQCQGHTAISLICFNTQN